MEDSPRRRIPIRPSSAAAQSLRPSPIFDRLAQITAILVVVALPWAFGGVRASEQSYLPATLLLIVPAVLVRFHRTVSAWRAVRLPLLLLSGAVGLGCLQLTHWAASSIAGVSPASLELRREYAATPDASADPIAGPLSLHPVSTRRELALLISVVTAYAVGAALFAETKALLALSAVAATVGAAVAVFGIVQKLTWEGLLFWTVPLTKGGQPFGPFVNRNNAGGFLLIGLAAAIGVLVWLLLTVPRLPRSLTVDGGNHGVRTAAHHGDEGVWRRVAWFLAHLSAPLLAAIAAVVLICGGILASLSRGSFVAMTVGGAIAVLMTFIASRRTSYVWILAVVAGGGVALVAWLGQTGEIRTRLETLTADQASAEPRIRHWRDSLHAAEDFWLLGSGFGTYRFAYTRYERRPSSGVYFHAENQYLEALVTGGAVGVTILIGLFVLFAVSLVRLMRHARTSADYGIAAVGATLFCTQAIHAAFDFAWYMPANFVPLALFAGGLQRRSAGLRDGSLYESPQPPRLLAMGLTGTAAAFLVVGLAWAFGETRRTAVCETAWDATRILPGRESTRNLNWVDAALAQEARAVAAAPDDGDARTRLAELWIERYRLRFRRQAELDPVLLSLGPLSSLWESPAKLHADASLMYRVGNEQGLAALRAHPLLSENLRPALAEARAARIACPLSPFPHLIVAQLCFLDESPLNDEFYLDRAERLSLGRDDWSFQIGALHIDAGRLDRAVSAWRRSWALSDRFERQIVTAASGYLTAQQIVEQLAPSDPRTLVRVARTYFTGSDRLYDRRVIYRRAIQLFDLSMMTPDDLFLRGVCQAETGDFTGATKSIEEAVKQAGGRPEWYQELAAIRRADGDQEGAAAVIRLSELASGKPLDLAAYRQRALELVLAQSPGSPDFVHRQGTLRRERGEMDQALELLRESVRLRPESAQWHFDLAGVLAGLGKQEEALIEAETAVRLAPQDSTFRELLEKMRHNR